MALQKILYKPGVNRENTRYTTEGGWYECDKIRFRQGNPEKLGGWTQFSSNTFLGTCRSLWNWVTLASNNLVGVGTNLKFYICQGGAYSDVTPIRDTVTLTNPFSATNGSSVITVTDSGHGCVTGDFVTYSGSGITGLGGNITAAVLTGEFQVTVVDTNTYTITVSATATPTDVSGSPGGGTVVTQYQLNTGTAYQIPLVGWGAGTWSSGTWGFGGSTATSIQLWNQMNFGQNLLYGPRGQGLYYWYADVGVNNIQSTISVAAPAVITMPIEFSIPDDTPISFVTTGALPTGLTVGTVYYVVNSSANTFNVSATLGGSPITTTVAGSGLHYISSRGIDLLDLGDADTPLYQDYLMVSDASRFVIVFGTNDYGSDILNPMLIRWSDQEDPFTWTPSATNQAGSVQLSHGSQIVMAVQTRQEIVVFTDQSLYSMQYLGAPLVWGVQLLGDNISIISANAAIVASGVIYWMGIDKFYKYDGRVQTLNCDLRRYVFQDFNILQAQQVYAGTNEGFNEVWWFYPSADSNTTDRYVVYNYVENVWHYGTMGRSAWLDSGLLPYPVAATYNGYLVNHEDGVDDNETGTPVAINAYISSSEFDIDDGHNFGYVWRVLPDLTFSGSSADPDGNQPQVSLTLYPMQNSGSGVGNPETKAVTLSTTYNVTEEYTGQVYTRVRGRQLIFEIESNQLGTTWQLGAPRIDIRKDGRR
ncbi:MAG: hypothetical protein EBS53_02395 [Bacteroidetes bacterium]|nr:hypothetical protein [Bacteroidota bacterium]